MTTTVPNPEPTLLRVVRNGLAAGAGMRIYVPKTRVHELGLHSGDHYRFQVLAGGRLRLTPVQYAIKTTRLDDAPPEPLAPARIQLELAQEEAAALEAYLVTGERQQRDRLLEVAKRIRRRMRLKKWPTIDRTNDKVELLP